MAKPRRRQAPRPPRATPTFRIHGEPGTSTGEASLETRLAWIAIAAMGAALLWMILGPHKVGDYFTETDFYGAYANGARALQHGILDPRRYGVVGPGYEVALAFVGFLVPSLFLAAELLSWVATLAGVTLWWDLLRRRTNARLALLATLFMVTNATLFRYGYSATTDGLAFALQSLALWLLLTGAAPLLAGLATALAFLTRYTAAALFAAGFVILLAGGTSHARRGRAAAFFVLGFALIVVPWVLFSLAHGGSLALQLHHNIAYDVFARPKGIPWDTYQKEMQPQFHSLLDVIARDPGAVFRRELFNVYDHLRLDIRNLLGVPVAVAAGLGILTGWWDQTLRRLWPLWLWAVLFFLSLVPSFYAERYSLPIVPVYAALAAITFASPRLAFAISRPRRLWLKPLLAVIPLAFALRDSVRTQQEVVSQLPVEVLEAGERLKHLRRPGERVLVRKPNIAFYGDVDAVPFPFTRTIPELAEYATSRGARWLYFSWPEAELRPDYRYLLDTSAVVPGLVPRFTATGHPAVLYEITSEFGAVPAWFASDTLRIWHDARARVLIDPTDTRSLYTLSVIAWSRKDYAGARSWLEALLERSPDELRALLLLGDVYIQQNDAPRALQVFARAELVAPGNPAVGLGHGWAYVIAHQPVEAATLWRPLVAQTNHVPTLERMVEIFHTVGYVEAETEARAALARIEKRSD